MSIIDDIETEISRVQTNISNAFDVLEDKGVTIPTDKSSNNLAISVEGAVPRIPTTCNSLIVWLDGDCNTRSGLDRTKRYYENIVWNVPIRPVSNNVEVFQANNTNSWNGNMLVLNSWALYPQFYPGTTSSCTIEAVFKRTDITKGLGLFCMAYKGGYVLYFSPNDTSINFYFNNNGTYIFNTQTLELNTTYYVCAIYNYPTRETHLIIPSMNVDIARTNMITESPNAGSMSSVGRGGSRIPSGGSSGTPEGNDLAGGGEIGMIRVWGRVLSSSEIQANYADAKTRFGCV